jgi:hypothetical protein
MLMGCCTVIYVIIVGQYDSWLVVWNLNFMTFHILIYIGNGVIIPTDELIFFRGVETTNQLSVDMCWLDIYT